MLNTIVSFQGETGRKMMRIKSLCFSFTILFFLTHLFLTYTAVSVEQINQLEGFGNLKWGTGIDSFQNMEFVKSGRTSQGEIKIYRNTTDNLNYSGIALSGIEYGFNDDKLSFVALKTEGIENWYELKNHAIQDYGQDFSKIENAGYENYVWQGSKSSIALQYNTKEDSSILLMASN